MQDEIQLSKKEQTRLHILDRALDLFWRTSYHAVNMNELSRAAGLNKATVYQHFSSKEEIAVAAIERSAERTMDWVYKDVFNMFSGPRERLTEIYNRVHETHRAIYDGEGRCIGCPFLNLGIELATSNEKVREAVKATQDSYIPYYQQIVRDLVMSGEISSDTDVDMMATSLIANINASLVASKIENRPGAILDGQRRAMNLVAA